MKLRQPARVLASLRRIDAPQMHGRNAYSGLTKRVRRSEIPAPSRILVVSFTQGIKTALPRLAPRTFFILGLKRSDRCRGSPFLPTQRRNLNTFLSSKLKQRAPQALRPTHPA